MKARVFPQLDIPDDLNNLGRFIDHYDTVQEQIEFLKYVKLEMELYYEPRFEEEIDAMDMKEYDDWNKILDKKIEFYESLLTDDIDKKIVTTKRELELNNYELFEKIITGDLRPHKYESDGKEFKEKVFKIGIKNEDVLTYLKYMDKEGIHYSVKYKDPENGKIIIDEKRNEEFNELIDIDIPPCPDEKGVEYLMLIEFEYARNIMTIELFVKENERSKIEEYAIRNFQKLRKMWEDLKHYRKLIIKGRGLDFEKSNDFVIMVLEVYIERTVIYLFRLFQPFVTTDFLELTIKEMFAERNEMFKKADLMFAELDLKKMAKNYEMETGNKLPFSIPTFEIIRKEILKLPRIIDQLVRYKDYLKYWKQALLNKPNIDVNQNISKTLITLIETEIENLEYKQRIYPETENIKENVPDKELRKFKRGELRKELKKYIKEFELKKGVTVESKKVQLITRKLRDEGWDATEQSVAVTLRKMEYGEEWKRDY